MKLNWRILISIVVMVVAASWMVSSVLTHTYNGANLAVGVGSGIVTVTNPSDAPATVQLVGSGSRSFMVSSSVDGVSGTSTKQGSGQASTQLFEFVLPPGVSEFSVVRGNNVNFISSSDTSLAVVVQPLSETESRTTLIVGLVVILGGLYYISRVTGHRWIKSLRRQDVPVPLVVAPVVAVPVTDPNRGRDGRMYSNYGGKD